MCPRLEYQIYLLNIILRDNVDLMALQQTEAFQRLDMSTQSIVNAVVENRFELLDTLYKHTHELQAMQLQTINEAVGVLHEDVVDKVREVGQHVERSQGQIQEDVNQASQVIQEHDSLEHQVTRAVVELQTSALGGQIEAESEDTRALVLDTSNSVRVAIDRVIDQIQTVHERLAQAHVVEQERSREEFRSWIIALLAQQARVIEAQAIAIRAGNESSAKTSSKRLRKALKAAQIALTRALEVLIELAEMFEQVKSLAVIFWCVLTDYRKLDFNTELFAS